MRRGGRFGEALARGRRFRGECLELVLARGPGDHGDFGVVVGRKVLASAVSRNRAKRILREAFRRHRHTLAPYFVIFRLRRAPKHPGMRDLAIEASELLQHARAEQAQPL